MNSDRDASRCSSGCSYQRSMNWVTLILSPFKGFHHHWRCYWRGTDETRFYGLRDLWKTTNLIVIKFIFSVIYLSVNSFRKKFSSSIFLFLRNPEFYRGHLTVISYALYAPYSWYSFTISSRPDDCSICEQLGGFVANSSSWRYRYLYSFFSSNLPR